jgi:hypothetical protein
MALFMRVSSGGFGFALMCSMAAIGPVQAQLAPPPRLLPSIKAPPPTVATPATAPPKAGWCEDDCLLAPGTPKPIELLAGERASSAFAVTQPGALRIELRATGAPLVLSLRRPDGRMVEREGSGAIVIEDNASAADIAKGVLWGLSVRTAQAAPSAKAARSPRAVAKGSLGVQHPTADKAVVRAALAKAAGDAEASAAAQPRMPAPPAVDAAAQTRLAQAANDKQVALRHAAQLTQLKATVPVAALAQMDQRIGLRLQGQTLQQAQAAVPPRPVIATAVDSSATSSLRAAPGAIPAKTIKGGLLVPAAPTGSTQAAATGGVAPVGAGGAAATAAAPPPVLATASAAEGDPGTPITLGGSNFGDAPGEVRFIVGNGRDIAAPVTFWSGSQVVTEVPYADGIPVYDGHLYVKRGDGTKSALRPFRFLPLYDVTEISLPERGDYQLAGSDNNRYQNGTVIHRGALFWGFNGNDKFYERSPLRNGWVVSGARLNWVGVTPGTGDAYLVEARPGTTSPFVNVRWWVNGSYPQPSFTVAYSVLIEVKRPKKLPCGGLDPCPVF